MAKSSKPKLPEICDAMAASERPSSDIRIRVVSPPTQNERKAGKRPQNPKARPRPSIRIHHERDINVVRLPIRAHN